MQIYKALKELGWKAEKSLEDMCRDAWRWQVNNPTSISYMVPDAYESLCKISKFAFSLSPSGENLKAFMNGLSSVAGNHQKNLNFSPRY